MPGLLPGTLHGSDMSVDLPGELLRAGAERLELQLGLTLPCSPGACWGQL